MARFTPSNHDIRYPRGYIRRLNYIAEKSVVDGDASIDELFNLYLSGKVNHQGWSYRKEVLEAAARLFKNSTNFIIMQRDNPHLYGYNYDFLQDTVNYIATGRRKLSIQAWKGLMSEHMPPTGDYKTRTVFVVDQEAKKIIQYSTAELISQWCSRPGGFEDLLQTMVVMFGRVWKPLHEVVTLHADFYDHDGDPTEKQYKVYK
jgi:hypothetical protein